MNKTIYTFILFLLIPFVAFGQDKIAVADFALKTEGFNRYPTGNYARRSKWREVCHYQSQDNRERVYL